MTEFDVSEKLEKILQKLSRKDKIRLEAALKKMDEIASSPDIEHYKNLSHAMKEFKRVHIDTHFVLIFKFDKKSGKVWFEDLQHHDDIYRR
ncbi:MAG: addiction module toxin RelE [Candidatus Diapherotrites archaeon]|nr:addiction module toxin RelE [Candidatus Diapherotrites archaeon]